MYKDPRLRCVKQKCLDLLTNVCTIPEVARLILDRHPTFLMQLIQGIRDGHLIEEKIPSLSVLLRLCKIIVERNLLGCYQHLIDMQFIDILLDLFENDEYKTNDLIIYFVKFESFALQCVHLMLQCAEHVDMWSEKAQIRLVNYCCTLLYKSVLEDEDKHQRSRGMKANHIIYAEQHGLVHSLSSAVLTFLNVVRCRKEIGRFYRENEHFRELINVMKQKYAQRSEFVRRDPSISCALEQVLSVMFDRHERKKRRYHPAQQSPLKEHLRNQLADRKCSNSLCHMVENDQVQFEDCPHCRTMSYCSQYCREVHWTLNHNLSCLPVNSNEMSSVDYAENNQTASIGCKTAFETLPVPLPPPPTSTDEVRQEITTNELCYPSSSASSSSSAATTGVKKKSFQTFLSLLRINKKRK
ncbi:unnamed protein product [Adineta ricciae]|uniref:MYND-type domain-containing protein n=1 Tax=Adineta ricciae TaxID=249248 RepID=A0A813VIN9_ADIRI|nr:unnamed protein product [Adineta ricciae]